MVARVGKFDTSDEEKAQNIKLMQGVHNNFPGLLGAMAQTKPDKQEWLRSAGFDPERSSEDFELFSVTDHRIQNAIKQVGRKLSCALYYRHTSNILPDGGRIAFRWFTNANFHEIPPVLKQVTPQMGETIRQNTSMGEQFFYRYGIANTKRAGAFVAFFHESIALMGFVFADAERVKFPDNAEVLPPFKHA